MKKKQIEHTWVMEFPKMSWERPFEEELLTYLRHMASSMERASAHHKEYGWFSNNSFSDQLAAMGKAYRTVQEHVEKEVEMRASIAKRQTKQ